MLAYSQKFSFNKTENENIVFPETDGHYCFYTAGIEYILLPRELPQHNLCFLSSLNQLPLQKKALTFNAVLISRELP